MGQIILQNGIAPSTPSSGNVSLYSKSSDKRLYYMDDTGAEIGPIIQKDKAKLSLNSAWSTTAGVYTKVLLDTAIFDSNSIIDLVNNRIVAKKTGYYYVSFNASLLPATSTTFGCRLYKNGAVYSQGEILTSAVVECASSTDIVQLTAPTDYIELFVYGSSVQPLNLLVGIQNFLSVVGPF